MIANGILTLRARWTDFLIKTAAGNESAPSTWAVKRKPRSDWPAQMIGILRDGIG
jgi:hypothetical protein